LRLTATLIVGETVDDGVFLPVTIPGRNARQGNEGGAMVVRLHEHGKHADMARDAWSRP
jgi:hypothetical protein